jgi:hypothetical protein
MCTCVGEIKIKRGGDGDGDKGATLGDDVSPRKRREGSVPFYLGVVRN